ncbi:MAG: dTMP kinase [Salinivirgaceae bacterium]|nr:dTMP kinase [Salinivirgaceae bacterium]
MAFIVIEGLDGAGKSTQLNMLRNLLNSKNIPFEYLHFPRVDEGVFGNLVSMFLRGDLGANNQVNPYLVALIYAGDRNDAQQTIRGWIDSGKLVIIDRYIYSNLAFQGAKIADAAKKNELRQWIKNLEYNYYGIPQPDLTLFLDVPFSFTTKSLTTVRTGDDRRYLQGKQDIHEADLNFQEQVRREYIDLAATEERFELVKCYSDDNQMLPPEQVFSLIVGQLEKYGVLPNK